MHLKLLELISRAAKYERASRQDEICTKTSSTFWWPSKKEKKTNGSSTGSPELLDSLFLFHLNWDLNIIFSQVALLAFYSFLYQKFAPAAPT